MTSNKRILGMLGLASKARKLSFGADSTLEELQKNKIKLIIVAEDASDRTKNKFIEKANSNNINIIVYATIDDLSKAIGKENKAVIGIKDANIAQEIEKMSRGDV